MKIFSFLLMCFGIYSTLASVLPSEFSMQSGPEGPTLTWSSEMVPIHVGGSRYEFRFSDGTFLGYPRVQRDELQVSLTSFQLQAMATQESTILQVWSSGRRIDGDAPPQSSPDAAATSSLLSTPTVPIDPAIMGTYKIYRKLYVIPVPLTSKGTLFLSR